LGLAALEAGSVDLVLSDLPSGETAAPFDKQADLDALFPAVWHALKPTGIAVLMASSLKFAMRAIEVEPEAYRYDLVWRKSLATGFYNAESRPLRAHEFVLVFWREKGAYHPQMWTGAVPISANRPRLGDDLKSNHGANYGKGAKATRSRAGEMDRFPVSVLDFPCVPNNRHGKRVHPQQKPEGLLAHLVRTYSSRGDLVADPYAGSGSTGRAATTEGRRFVGWELEQKFVDAAGSFTRSLFEVPV
jgi:site-specific DNA-methyltransferase (adenine-specific)